MNLVREHINEKFTQDSDPVHDMGIGSTELIKKARNKIIKFDHHYHAEYNPRFSGKWTSCTTLLMGININRDSNIIEFSCYSNTFRDAKNKKIIDKREYCKKLLDIAGIIHFTDAGEFDEKNLFVNADPDPLCTTISFNILPNYVEFFKKYF